MSVDTKNPSALEEWVEPEICTLPVEETAGSPGVGADGGGAFDCSLS